MADDAPLFPSLSRVEGKEIRVSFDGGRLSSDGGLLLLAEIERRLGIADRLAAKIADRRRPDRSRHSLAEMIRYRAMMIASGYEDANDADALRCDPAFKLAVGRLPEGFAIRIDIFGKIRHALLVFEQRGSHVLSEMRIR